MSTMSVLGRLGRDAELKFMPNGDAVANIAVAYNYGKKQDGKQPSQWIDCSIFGKRAEALAPHLTKGQQVFLVLEDVHIRQWSKPDGSIGSALSGKVIKLEFAGGQSAQAPQAKQNPSQHASGGTSQQYGSPQSQHQPTTDFSGFDDDLPF